MRIRETGVDEGQIDREQTFDEEGLRRERAEEHEKKNQ